MNNIHLGHIQEDSIRRESVHLKHHWDTADSNFGFKEDDRWQNIYENYSLDDLLHPEENRHHKLSFYTLLKYKHSPIIPSLSIYVHEYIPGKITKSNFHNS